MVKWDAETGECLCGTRCVCGATGGEIFADESGHECSSCYSNVDHAVMVEEQQGECAHEHHTVIKGEAYCPTCRKAWNVGSELVRCEWYALCENLTRLATAHPALGPVPICERCAAKHDITPEYVIEAAL